MTLAQLASLKAWHVAHKAERPIEFHTCDAVLTLRLLGWMGAPGMVLLDEPWAVIACVMLFFVPQAYVALRRRLHDERWLRCDWLDLLPPTSRRALRH